MSKLRWSNRLRSPEAQAWRRFYNTKEWKQARTTRLAFHPLCERCLRLRRRTAATVVNHRRPHKGDWQLFIDPENHESLCKPHHDSSAQVQDHKGFSPEIGLDGQPTDPNHPFNRS